MMESVLDRQSATASENEVDHAQLRMQREHIIDQYREYIAETFEDKKIAGAEETALLKNWIKTQDASEKGVESLRTFYDQFLRQQLRSGRALHAKFYGDIDRALANRWISKDSHDRWIDRFENRSLGYKAREYWMKSQMAPFMRGWEETADGRKNIIVDPAFDTLAKQSSEFAVLKNEKTFLDLHFDLRKGLVAKARAALLAEKSERTDLYAKAESKLMTAASRGFLAHGKVGVWLERVFKSNAAPKKVEAFVSGNDRNSLNMLMMRWEHVRKRYDKVSAKFMRNSSGELPRGIELFSPAQFLNLHYTQRLHYVENMENRLGNSADLSDEPDSFIRIRHAIDTGEWAEASLLIEEAKKESLEEKDRLRLDSMRRYVQQFGERSGSESLQNATQAKDRIDELLGQIPSSLQPMVLRLLKGPHANRSINQFRWIVYNNKWCRSHGYLTPERAMDGASKDREEETKFRKEHGLDTGIVDSIGHETSDQTYFRDKEFANHKPTYLQINLASGAPNALAGWLERKQDSKVLYWTIFNGHENSVPMPENWHNDLFHVLTEMRSATHTIQEEGYMYHSPNELLQPV